MMVEELMSGLSTVFWTQGRLETYENKWPFKPNDGICTAERMAAAGFFVVDGDDDSDVTVECFICSKQLDGWEPNDDPWQEHSKRQTECPYVILNKQDEKQWTIEDLFGLMKAYYVKQCTRRIGEVVKSLKADSGRMAREIPKIYRAERGNRISGRKG